MKLSKHFIHIAVIFCLSAFCGSNVVHCAGDGDGSVEIEMVDMSTDADHGTANERSQFDLVEHSDNPNSSAVATPRQFNDYFTTRNTQITVITADSIADFINQNKLTPEFKVQDIHLDQLVKNLKFKELENISTIEQRNILNGMNQFMHLEVLDQFHVHQIQTDNPNAYNIILNAIGDVIGQYFYQDDRPYGFNFIMLLKDQAELWICEIPSKSEIDRAVANTKRANNGAESPFSGKEAEVLAAMEMFEPLLNKLFIEGRSQEVQERRKACWTCTKGSAIILVIVIIAVYMFIGATSGLITAIDSVQNQGT